jgi:RimJ/RimL family protein N-acetyltransferase
LKSGVTIKQFTARDGRDVILRTPRWEDLDDCIEFVNSLVDEGADVNMYKKVTRKEEAAWLDSRLAELDRDLLFMIVAEVDGKMIGNSSLSIGRGFSSHTGEIGIALRMGYRDVGIGTEILKTLIFQAKKLGCRTVYLSVFSSNERAIHVYEKIGFKETGRKPDKIFKNERYIDEIIMTKVLEAI